MTEEVKTVWKIKKDHGRFFMRGHPWVFSNELAQSPKGLKSGAWVELQDSAGAFLATGYGNPASLISFRTLSRDSKSRNQNMDEVLYGILKNAFQWRHAYGLTQTSYRLCMAEADGLPGVVIDSYMVTSPSEKRVFSIQINTAGGEHCLEGILAGLERLYETPVCAVLVRDSKSRLLEGLKTEPKSWIGAPKGFESGYVKIKAAGSEFWIDLLRGQKTGFYLDQISNIKMAQELVKAHVQAISKTGHKTRILDLFSYVGQWGIGLATAAKQAGGDPEVLFADASGAALELATKNAELGSVTAKTLEADLLEKIPDTGTFSVVVCDPPALIKKKKDVPTGRKAYIKLNREALKRVDDGGLFNTCSCSGLFEEVEFRAALAIAASQAGKKVNWIATGGHAPDHPRLAEFPEGQYLKCWMGVVTAL